MRKLNAVSLFVALLALTSFAAQSAEVKGRVELVSDYRFHGISQTGGDPALQGQLWAEFESGPFAGVWGSNVDFGDDANLELDWFAGYYGAINNTKLDYQVFLNYVTYPGYDAVDGDYLEIHGRLRHNERLTLTYQYMDSYFNTGKTAQYASLNYKRAITKNNALFVRLHAGHSYGDYWEQLDIGDYSDFSVGLMGTIKGLVIAVDYLFNDIESVNQIDSGLFRNDNTIVGRVCYPSCLPQF